MPDHTLTPDQRIRALEAELAILRAADTDPDDTKLTGITGEPGQTTVSLRPPELLMRAFIASMIDMLGDATNYVEMEAEEQRAEILRIVADWISEYYDTGGIGPDDLEWRLKQAGYPIPAVGQETTSNE